MRRWSSRYAHVPLAVTSLIVLLSIIAWLLGQRLDLWRVVTAPPPPVVAVPPGPGPAPADPTAEEPSPSAVPPAGRDAPAPEPGPRERYSLESGPFALAEAADRVEDQLNGLGHATVRFRKHDQSRHYVVAAAGFASLAQARDTARRLGRGTPAEVDGAVELVVERLPSLGEAVAVSRLLRTQGLDVRVRESVEPSLIYYIRHGDFTRRSDADVRSRELARLGLSSRVVRLRGADAPPGLTPRTAGSEAPPGAVP